MQKSTFEILQMEAVEILLDETFRHVHEIAHEQYQAIGKTNAQLLLVATTRFIHKGVIYPSTPTSSYQGGIPTLHYSLISELESINKLVISADYHAIKNFFVAAISQSHNGIVLDGVLPAVLVNTLRAKFIEYEFKSIDMGICDGLKPEPLSTTQQNIQLIKDHYASTISTIRNLLMDKLLLQS